MPDNSMLTTSMANRSSLPSLSIASHLSHEGWTPRGNALVWKSRISRVNSRSLECVEKYRSSKIFTASWKALQTRALLHALRKEITQAGLSEQNTLGKYDANDLSEKQQFTAKQLRATIEAISDQQLLETMLAIYSGFKRLLLLSPLANYLRETGGEQLHQSTPADCFRGRDHPLTQL